MPEQPPLLGLDTRVSHISKKENGILVDVATQFNSKKYVIPVEDLFEDADTAQVTENYDIQATWNGISHTMTVPDHLKPNSSRRQGGKEAQ